MELLTKIKNKIHEWYCVANEMTNRIQGLTLILILLLLLLE